MSSTTVSILMPVYNAQGSLRAAVESVQAQSYKDWELILVDDASTDKSYDVAQSLMQTDHRLYLARHQTNQGAAQARNTALHQAKGRYIAFLDADDLWHPEKLKLQITAMQTKDASFSFTGFERRQSRRARPVRVPEHIDYKRLLKGNVIGCLTVVYDSATLGKRPMPDLRMRQDFALWLDILREAPGVAILPQVLATHHRNPGSLSSDFLKSLNATWAVYRREGLGPFRSAAYLMRHYMNRFRAIYSR